MRSVNNYSIQSKASGPRHSNHKSSRQECHTRGEAHMEPARASTSSQMYNNNFDTLIESPEAEITVIPVIRSEQLQTSRSRDIPISVQELVSGRKEEGVGSSSKPSDKENELTSSSDKALRTRRYRGPSKRLDSNICQRESPKDKILVKKQRILLEDQKKLAQNKVNSPVEAPQSTTSKNPPLKVLNTGKNSQRLTRKERKRQRKSLSPSGTRLTLRITEFQREKRHLWKMC
ncbi:hypothetical protein O181_108716 [Austropuccinia psidii MF-1]|uniref:Uncharacterized protein n=1 Tax=Austropuccinia psidii MF-1 TaxID=1389203 RepID=A0A9Q3PQ90_9BASI|nr:hypothetical protein [Austropuccinia psidii MF-1]